MDKMTILAVDDNIINLATIEQELKDKYDVVTVNSGVRAIRYLNKEKPDLVLLDVQMEGNADDGKRGHNPCDHAYLQEG